MRFFDSATLSLLALTCFAHSLFSATAFAAPSESTRTVYAKSKPSRTAVQRADPRVTDLLRRVEIASRAAKTMTADFTYSVTTIKRIQFVKGSVRLMKPNFAKIALSFVAEPAYPNVFGSDGKNIYSFTPSNFNTQNRTFTLDPAFDPITGAKAASGLGGRGTIETEPVARDGANIHLWDSIAIQSFFNVSSGLEYLYHNNLSELHYEGKQTIDGVPYQVISHYYPNGNIPGKETTPFWQRIYIGPDYLIHRYVLEYKSGGRPGIQVMRLENIRLNSAAPLTAADFAVSAPSP